MFNFDIVKEHIPDKTFRVSKIAADFDIDTSKITEHFKGSIYTPDKWNIGVIVGASGTGKTTIAKSIFGDNCINNNEYSKNSVIDDMPNDTIENITRMFYAVGFGSVPNWIKPYSILSNGEKMRVDLARALLQNNLIVFDEFTSVVDRNVAQTACIAINNAIKNTEKQFVAISCHYDVLEWLQPDWVFDTNTMQSFFGKSLDQRKYLKSNVVSEANGQSLNDIII